MDTTQETLIDPREFRNCLGRFATGVTVITTEVDGQVHGMTANGFMSVSLEPPLVLISVGNKARLNSFLPQSMSYGVSILSEQHEHFSRHFAGRPVEGLAIPLVKKKGVPVLEGAAACLVARVVDIHPAGDHTLYIGQVEYLETSETRPLLFFAGKYRMLDPEPKHPMEAWIDHGLFFFDPSGGL
ncbi:MAG: flavin reductase family protein [Anaerolineae bacterium]|nr:flavin reductase family protein [Anaerolineae bacterium]